MFQRSSGETISGFDWQPSQQPFQELTYKDYPQTSTFSNLYIYTITMSINHASSRDAVEQRLVELEAKEDQRPEDRRHILAEREEEDMIERRLGEDEDKAVRVYKNNQLKRNRETEDESSKAECEAHDKEEEVKHLSLGVLINIVLLTERQLCRRQLRCLKSHNTLQPQASQAPPHKAYKCSAEDNVQSLNITCTLLKRNRVYKCFAETCDKLNQI